MKWPKLKSLIEATMLPAMAQRVTINAVAEAESACGHFWVTLDDDIVANFCTKAQINTPPQQLIEGLLDNTTPNANAPSDDVPSNAHPLLSRYGSLSRQDAYLSCWAFAHHLSIEEAIASGDPVIQSLAVMDVRLQSPHLQAVDTQLLCPLAKALYRERMAISH